MLEIDLALPHTYDVEELGELPGTGKFSAPLVFIPPPKNRPEHTGLWLKIKGASGRCWIGIFAFGYDEPPAISRILGSFDPDRVCVVSRGAAYIVKADDPGVWEVIPVMPVLDVRLVPEKQILIFSGFTQLAAYGREGIAWRSPRVCWDELRIVSVKSETIEGTGYDPTNSITRESRFIVDLNTGRSLLPSPVSNEGTPIW